MTDINLIKKTSRVTAKRLKYLRILSIVLAVAVAFTSTGLFIVTRQNSIDSIKAQQNFLLQNITLLGDKAAKINFLNDRVKNIESITKERKTYTKTVATILEGLPSNVTTNSLTLSEEDMLLTVSSNSLAAVNEFLNTTIAVAEEKHLLRDLTIESLTAQERTYTLTLKAKIL